MSTIRVITTCKVCGASVSQLVASREAAQPLHPRHGVACDFQHALDQHIGGRYVEANGSPLVIVAQAVLNASDGAAA